MYAPFLFEGKFTPDEPSIATAMLEPLVQKRWLVRAAVTQADLALALEHNAKSYCQRETQPPLKVPCISLAP